MAVRRYSYSRKCLSAKWRAIFHKHSTLKLFKNSRAILFNSEQSLPSLIVGLIPWSIAPSSGIMTTWLFIVERVSPIIRVPSITPTTRFCEHPFGTEGCPSRFDTHFPLMRWNLPFITGVFGCSISSARKEPQSDCVPEGDSKGRKGSVRN